MRPSRRPTPVLPGLLITLLLGAAAHAQDLEPRRWTHLPVGMNVLGVGLVESQGEIAVDPVTKLSDVRVESRQEVLAYTHVFDLLGKTARVDVVAGHRQARWKGKVDGTPAHVRRSGFIDPRIRLSVDLVGAPALKGKEYMDYRTSRPIHTIVGASLSVTLPEGEYKPDKLLNLGENRYTIRPQVGVLHIRGPWSYELSGSVFYYSDNNDFFGGMEREQDPTYALQAHVVRTFERGWWVAGGVGYGWGGESTIDGSPKDDRRADLLSGASFGFPISQSQGVKLAYIRRTTKKDLGADMDSVIGSWSIRF